MATRPPRRLAVVRSVPSRAPLTFGINGCAADFTTSAAALCAALISSSIVWSSASFKSRNNCLSPSTSIAGSVAIASPERLLGLVVRCFGVGLDQEPFDLGEDFIGQTIRHVI